MSEPSYIGLEIGSYRITEPLGKGGMGAVYLALHPGIGKRVAVKILQRRLAAEPESLMRFFREAKAVNDIHHENIIDVIDFGRTSGGDSYLIMEYLEGQPLSAALSAAPFDARRLAHVALQICSALAGAHAKGIIHRDLKPDNIFLITRGGRADFVKLLDFGIAKLQDNSVPVHTRAGAALGTPQYMAPEQAMGRAVDAQTDIYALGVILYQMATGTLPFSDPSPIVLASMHVNVPPPPPLERNPALSPKIAELITRCLEKEKERRFPSVFELAAALGESCGVDPAAYFPYNSEKLPKTSISGAQAQADPPAGQAGESLPIPPVAVGAAAQPRRRSGLFALLGVLGLAALGLAAFGLPRGEGDEARLVPSASQVSSLPLEVPSASASVPASVPAPEPPEEPARPTKPKAAKGTKKTEPKKGNKRAGDFPVDPFAD